MFRDVLNRLTARLRGDETESESSTDDDTRFVPSPLDRSVRYAHGGSDAEVARELADVDETARRLERQREK